MKNSRHLIVSAICVLFSVVVFSTSCITDDFDIEPAVENVDPYAVSVDDALDEMYSLMDVLYGPQTRASTRRVASVSTFEPKATQTRALQVKKAVYLVNFEDEGGFAVLGATEAVDPVICITEGGSLTIEDLEQAEADYLAGPQEDDEAQWMSYEDIHNFGYGPEGNPEPFDINDYNSDWDEAEEEGIEPYEDTSDFMVSRAQEIVTTMLYRAIARDCHLVDTSNIEGAGGYRTIYTYSDWTDVAATKVGPLIETDWHQWAPFNNKCPKTTGGQKNSAGCVAIAIAQIVACNEKPAPTFFNKNITSTWAELKDYGSDHYYGLSLNVRSRIENDLAEMVRKIGDGVNMWYGAPGTASSATPAAAKCYFKKFYKSVDKHEYYSKRALDDMLNGRRQPAFILAFAGLKSAHAWVADGLVTQTRTKTGMSEGRVVSTSTETRKLIHYNFGWGGPCDGYYAIKEYVNLRKGPAHQEPGMDTSDDNTSKNNYDWCWRVIKYKTE